MKQFVIKTKETWEMDVEYYLEAESEEDARKKFESGEYDVDADDQFVATISSKIEK